MHSNHQFKESSMFSHATRLVPLLAATLLLNACATLKETIKEPNVSVDAVNLRDISLSNLQLDFLLGIDNPNPLGIAMQGLTYNLAIDGKQMFDGVSTERVSVPANGNSQVTLPFAIDFEQLLSGFEDLRNKKTVSYDLTGKVDLGLISLPYSKRGEFTLPTLPKLSVSKLKVTGFDLAGVGLVLGLNVANDNDFALKLSGLTGDFKLAGIPLVKGKSLGGMNIDANNKGQVELALKVAYSKLGDVINALRSGQTMPVAFDGAMSVPTLGGERQVPINWNGNVPISR
jgi:LEA14-like dessication related protein